MNALRVSVIIPTYRRRALVERALHRLAHQTLPPEQYEIVVAIDGSEDGTRELVAGFSAPFQVRGVWQPNRGRAAACNAGARVATGELLVLLDDDMEPPPEHLAAHLRAHPPDSSLGVLGAVPVIDRGSKVAQFIAVRFDRHLAKLGQESYRLKLRDFYSGNFSIRRDRFWAVGGFDEAFRIYGNEDLELALRLIRAGVRLTYSVEAAAHQRYTKTFADLAHDNVAKGRTAVLLARKHPEALQELRLSTDEYGTPAWRWIRRALLGLSRAWDGTPSQVVRLVTTLERSTPRRPDLCYTLALDYFYWLGAQAAAHEYVADGRAIETRPAASPPAAEVPNS